jgi:hypothetical protein
VPVCRECGDSSPAAQNDSLEWGCGAGDTSPGTHVPGFPILPLRGWLVNPTFGMPPNVGHQSMDEILICKVSPAVS